MGKAKSAAARTRGAGAPAGAQGGRARPNPNPFEVKVNRQKFPVLGRKARHAVGQPGVSRARAVHKVRVGGRAAGTGGGGDACLAGTLCPAGGARVPRLPLASCREPARETALGGLAARVCSRPPDPGSGRPCAPPAAVPAGACSLWSGGRASLPSQGRELTDVGGRGRLSFRAQQRVPRVGTEMPRSVLSVPEYPALFGPRSDGRLRDVVFGVTVLVVAVGKTHSIL